jgi:hypothetical protein
VHLASCAVQKRRLRVEANQLWSERLIDWCFWGVNPSGLPMDLAPVQTGRVFWRTASFGRGSDAEHRTRADEHEVADRRVAQHQTFIRNKREFISRGIILGNCRVLALA